MIGKEVSLTWGESFEVPENAGERDALCLKHLDVAYDSNLLHLEIGETAYS